MRPFHRRTWNLLLALGVSLACAGSAPAGVAVGQQAPGFTLPDLDGGEVSLADYAGKVVVLEWLNPNCPFSDRHAREKTMSDLARRWGGDGVVWLGINSSNPSSGDYVPPAQHKKWAAKRGIGYPILYDRSGDVGHAYGAKTTPDMFVIDASGTLVYAGAIDDDPPGREAAAGRRNYVDGALTALADGAPVDPASTRPYGCSVKY